MPRHADMMILTAEQRREHFRRCYALELTRLHATGKCAWHIDRLPDMVSAIMHGIAERRVPAGPAFDATLKFFGLKTQKALFAFLEV